MNGNQDWAKGNGAYESVNIDGDDVEALFEGFSLGMTVGYEAGTGKEVFQPTRDGMQHTFYCGETGVGKSNAMKCREFESIKSGCGVFILASHDSDAQYALSVIPENRLDDVIYFDASNSEYLPRFNPLDVDVNDRTAVDKVISDVIDLLEQGVYHEYTGPQFKRMARLGLETLLDPGFKYERTLENLPLLFMDFVFRKKALVGVKNKKVLAQWDLEEKASSSGEYAGGIQWFTSKFHQITQNRMLRRLLSSGKPTINLKEIVAESKIFISLINSARTGEAPAAFLKGYILKQLRDAVLSRVPDADGVLNPIDIYIDECQKYTSELLVSLLAEARKNDCRIFLASQTTGGLRTFNTVTGYQDNSMIEAILGNVGSIFCFRLGSLDARIIADHFDIDPSRLKHIGRYKAFAKVLIDNQPTRLILLDIPLAPQPENTQTIKRIEQSMIDKGIWLLSDQNGTEVAEEESDREGDEAQGRWPFLDDWLEKRREAHRGGRTKKTSEDKSEAVEERRTDSTSTTKKERDGPLWGYLEQCLSEESQSQEPAQSPSVRNRAISEDNDESEKEGDNDAKT